MTARDMTLAEIQPAYANAQAELACQKAENPRVTAQNERLTSENVSSKASVETF